MTRIPEFCPISKRNAEISSFLFRRYKCLQWLGNHTIFCLGVVPFLKYKKVWASITHSMLMYDKIKYIGECEKKHTKPFFFMFALSQLHDKPLASIC